MTPATLEGGMPEKDMRGTSPYPYDFEGKIVENSLFFDSCSKNQKPVSAFILGEERMREQRKKKLLQDKVLCASKDTEYVQQGRF